MPGRMDERMVKALEKIARELRVINVLLACVLVAVLGAIGMMIVALN